VRTNAETDSGQANGALPPELSLSGTRKRPVSPLNNPVWRFLLYVSGGCLGAWLIPSLSGLRSGLIVWVSAALLTASWVVAIRMLFVDARAKRFWFAWLILGALPLLYFGRPDLTWVSVIFSVVFLFFRRYRPYRHLTGRRQGWLFVIGIVVFFLLTAGWPSFNSGSATDVITEKAAPPTPQTTDILLTKGRSLLGYSLDSLRFFWFFSLFNLFFSIRLHFMRLRPKLAVSTFLVAVFPVLLVIVMGLITLYGLLGESRALRASAILREWAAFAVRDQSFMSSVSDKHFSTADRGGEEGGFAVTGDKPVWLDEFLAALKADNYSPAGLNPADAAIYFWIKGEVWLIDLSRAAGADSQVKGCQVGSAMLDRLAAILDAEVLLYRSNPINLFPQSGRPRESITLSQEDVERALRGVFPSRKKAEMPRPVPSESFWQRPHYFGMSNLDVITYDSGNFGQRSILLAIKASLASVFGESVSLKNPLAEVILGILIAAAVVLLFMEALALFFGVRIVTGITQAVKSLLRGTRRIAGGDLDTPILIPNEDEFGDLAFSFNQMAGAVKKGREEAIARGILERELKTAREIQERLLPHEMPRVPGFEICGTSLPSRQVGGDYFDFIELETGELAIAIGDVSGKGMPAALLMASLQASFHAQVLRTGAVSELLSRMNHLLVQSTDKHMFVTFFYGALNRIRSTFAFSNAGHNPPLLFRTDGRIERLEAGGLLLGFLPDQTYAQGEVGIEPGDIVILYTDGITEARAPFPKAGEGQLFGEERLIDVVRAVQSRPAPEIQAAVLRAISRYTADTPQEDDITLVIIRRISS
jgi:HAMP domain-containing protein